MATLRSDSGIRNPICPFIKGSELTQKRGSVNEATAEQQNISNTSQVPIGTAARQPSIYEAYQDDEETDFERADTDIVAEIENNKVQTKQSAKDLPGSPLL